MNLKNQRPIFVPKEFIPEIEKMSKAALMDLVWDLATVNTPSTDKGEIMGTLRAMAETVLIHRKHHWSSND